MGKITHLSLDLRDFMEIKAKKSLGQNFLQDETILKRISDSIKTSKEDLVVEIGPGKGALTKYLKEKESFLICYELDERLKDILQKLEDDKTKIIFKDFLKADILEDSKSFKYENIYIIANIPYYITTPIIKHVINLEKLQSMTLLVQKEVAERLCALPGSKSYGSLTVYLNYYFNINYLFTVNRFAFNPIPKVESAVINFKRKIDKPKVKNENLLFNLINDAFKMKRKTLKNNLKEYDWNKIKTILEKNNLKENVRAEELSLEIFIEITNILT